MGDHGNEDNFTGGHSEKHGNYGHAPVYNPPPGYYPTQTSGPSTIQMQPQHPAGVAPYNAPGAAPYSTPGVAPHTVIIQQESHSRYSMMGHIAFSCAIFWCCNCLFGGIAFFVALSGMDQQEHVARQRGRISMILNIVGLVLTVVAVIIILGLYFGLGLWHTQSVYNNYGYK